MTRPAIIARLAGDKRGMALIEFAICLPAMLLLFVGGFQISDAVFAYRRVTATTRTLADLTSQYTTVTNADLDTILAASQQVLAPYSADNATMRITQVTIDDEGNATVDWSRAKNTTAHTVGTTFAVPSAHRRDDVTMIVAEIRYTYVPTFSSVVLGTIPLADRIDMMPRKSTAIDLVT